MKIVVTKASDYKYKEYVDVSSVDELLAIGGDENLILIKDDMAYDAEGCDLWVVIYDDYWE